MTVMNCRRHHGVKEWQAGSLLGSLSVATAATVLAIGCASKPKSSSDAAAARTGSDSFNPQSTNRTTADLLRERLMGTNNGLEIRRLTVLDAADQALAIVAGYSDGGGADQNSCERLRQNGLRFARVPAHQLDSIVAALGGATVDRTEWHGQVLDWRSLREQPIDGRGTAVAIDGRVRRFDRGEFRLLLRGWTVMMEDGPHMHVELLPQHHLPSSNNLRVLLAEKQGVSPDDAGEAFASMALDLELQAGFAYVLISESPSIDWPQLDAPAPDAATVPASAMRSPAAQRALAASEQGAAPPPAVAPQRGRLGPDESIGPDAGAPRTLGEVLLPSMISPRTREIVVFVPRIPEEMFPPVYASDLQSPAQNSHETAPADRTRRRVDR